MVDTKNPETIKEGRILKIIGPDLNLWNMDTYKKKLVKKDYYGGDWPGDSKGYDAKLWLPPLTSGRHYNNGGDWIAHLKPGTLVRAEKILFHSDHVENNDKMYQCMKITAYVNQTLEEGFVWTIYKGKSYAKYVGCDTSIAADDTQLKIEIEKTRLGTICKGIEKVRKGPTTPIYVLDCGAWLTSPGGKTTRTFGVISGNYIILAQLIIKPGHSRRTSVSNAQWQKAKYDPHVKTFKSGVLKKLFQFDATRSWNLEIIKYEYDQVEFCNKDHVYVFIPDMHICFPNDPMNQFMNDKDNAKYLLKYLTYCKDLLDRSITIVQTGDLFDIWTAEAQRDIYYMDAGGGKLKLRPRVERLWAAAAFLDLGIKNTEVETGNIGKMEKLESLLKKFDYYCPGNHDHEVFLTELPDFLKDKGKGVIKDEKDVQFNSNCSFIVTHGHQYDKGNDTYTEPMFTEYKEFIRGGKSQIKIRKLMKQFYAGNVTLKKDVIGKKVINYCNLLMAVGNIVNAKGATFWDSREKRNEKLRYSKIVFDGEYIDPNDYEYFLDIIKTMYNEFPPFVERLNFNSMRDNIIKRIAKNFKKNCEAGQADVQGEIFPGLVDDKRNIYWDGPKSDPPILEANEGPYHAIVHSHTHMPMLTKITIKKGKKPTNKKVKKPTNPLP